jgi:hypothetical protein
MIMVPLFTDNGRSESNGKEINAEDAEERCRVRIEKRATARASASAGILRCAQDDGVEQATAKATEKQGQEQRQYGGLSASL